MSVSAVTNLPETVVKALMIGDLTGLNPSDKLSYYRMVCESVGLNPLTKPFEYIRLNGKEVLYAGKSCAEQLRKMHGISVSITAREKHDTLYVITARATTNDGRSDESMAAIDLAGLKGDALANSLMKCETKAKRRVTLSICGLGMLDETEVASIPAAAVQYVDNNTGEVTAIQKALPETSSQQLLEEVQRNIDGEDLVAIGDHKIATKKSSKVGKSVRELYAMDPIWVHKALTQHADALLKADKLALEFYGRAVKEQEESNNPAYRVEHTNGQSSEVASV